MALRRAASYAATAPRRGFSSAAGVFSTGFKVDIPEINMAQFVLDVRSGGTRGGTWPR
jgi:hypothetical protein